MQRKLANTKNTFSSYMCSHTPAAPNSTSRYICLLTAVNPLAGLCPKGGRYAHDISPKGGRYSFAHDISPIVLDHLDLKGGRRHHETPYQNRYRRRKFVEHSRSTSVMLSGYSALLTDFHSLLA